MKLSDYKFELPYGQYPQRPEHEPRILGVTNEGELAHIAASDVAYVLRGGCMVSNDAAAKSIHLWGIKANTGAVVEVLLLRCVNRKDFLWEVFISPAKQVKQGEQFYLGDDEELMIEVVESITSRSRIIRFLGYDDISELHNKIAEQSTLGRSRLATFSAANDHLEVTELTQDITRFVAMSDTEFALDKLFRKQLELEDVTQPSITYHTGIGSYRAVETQDLSRHQVDVEEYEISLFAEKIINNAIGVWRPLCAAGVEVLRALESSVSLGMLKATDQGRSTEFFYPPKNIKITTHLLTNLHLPQSPQLMTACAFAGHERVMKAHRNAVEQGYSFGPYGDLLFIER